MMITRPVDTIRAPDELLRKAQEIAITTKAIIANGTAFD
jgi:hypothetical protein